MIDRVYCFSCRRTLVETRFNLKAYEDREYQFCSQCERIMTLSQETQILEGESAIATLLWRREGGEREIPLPIGRVDLVTDEYVVEVKHVAKWLDAIKVLAYAAYFPGRKPRVHLFGMHPQKTRELITESLEGLGLVVTFENEPFEKIHPAN